MCHLTPGLAARRTDSLERAFGRQRCRVVALALLLLRWRAGTFALSIVLGPRGLAGGAGAAGVVWWGSGVLRLSNIDGAAPEGHVGPNAWPPAILLHRPSKKTSRRKG